MKRSLRNVGKAHVYEHGAQSDKDMGAACKEALAIFLPSKRHSFSAFDMPASKYRFIQGYIYQKTGRFSTIGQIHRWVRDLCDDDQTILANQAQGDTDAASTVTLESAINAHLGTRKETVEMSASNPVYACHDTSAKPAISSSMSQRRLASNIPTLSCRVVLPPLQPFLSSSRSVVTPGSPLLCSGRSSPVHLPLESLSFATFKHHDSQPLATPVDQILHMPPAPPSIPRFPSTKTQGSPLRDFCSDSTSCGSLSYSPLLENSLDILKLQDSSFKYRRTALRSSTPTGTVTTKSSDENNAELTVKPLIPTPPATRQLTNKRTHVLRLGLGPRRLSYKHSARFGMTPSPGCAGPSHQLASPFSSSILMPCKESLRTSTVVPELNSQMPQALPMTSHATLNPGQGYFASCQ